MKTIQVLFVAALCGLLNSNLVAQVSEYSHPPTIMAQETIQMDKNSTLSVTPDMLVIHDVDDANFSEYSVALSAGANYSAAGNVLSPDLDFTGRLYVPLTVDDGKHQSAKFTLEVEVVDSSLAFRYEVLGQKKIEIKRGKSFTIRPEHIAVSKVPNTGGAVFYVSPKGNDSNPGTIDQPLKTFASAKLKVYRYKSANGIPEGGITVFFREGNYYTTGTVNFSSSDSGQKGRPITYRAYPFENVNITGAKTIKHEWIVPAPSEITSRIKKVEARSKIKMVNLKANGILTYGRIEHVGYGVGNKPTPPANIFVDGKAMHLARYPDANNMNDISTATGQNVFISRTGVVNTWQQTGDIWIDGPLSKAWEWKKNRIQSVSETGQVTLAYNAHSDITTSHVNMFYFNVLEELDYQGEFFMDRSKGILYFYPPEGLNETSDIIISQSSSKLISMNGTDYVRFIDMKFSGTRNSAFELKNNANDNQLINCEVYAIGLDGLTVNGYRNKVLNSHVHDIGANGIYLNGGSSSSLTPARNLVENCKIHDFSQERRAYNPGLAVFGVGQIMRHVELYNGPHMAVKIKGNNHLIEYCDFHDAPREYSDMLGIYFNTGNSPLDRGTILRRNKFHDVSGTWKQSAGVYMDNETSGVLIEENYFFDNIAGESGWSVMVHGGADNVVRKNVFVYASYPFAISHRLNGYAADEFEGRLDRWQNEFASRANANYFTEYPELNRFFDDEGVTPNPMTYKFIKKYGSNGTVINYWDRRTSSFNVFTDNLVYNERQDIFAMPPSSNSSENRGFYNVSNFRKINGEMQENIIAGNNYNVTSNPGFVDYANRDLSFQSGAVDKALLDSLPHLTHLPFATMGLKDKVGVQFNDFKVDSTITVDIVEHTPLNYTYEGNKVMPNAGYLGDVSVPIAVRVGADPLKDYPFTITILNEYEPDSIKIIPGDFDLAIQEEKQLDVILYPDTFKNYTVKWKLLGGSFASLSDSGKILGLEKGLVQVVASVGDVSDTISVNVVEVFASGVRLSASSYDAYVNENFQLAVDVQPENTTDKAIKWETGNQWVVAIDQNGKCEALKEGNTFVVAKNRASGLTDTCYVTVSEVLVTQVRFVPDQLDLKQYDLHTFQIEVIPDSATNKRLKWTVNDRSILSINSSGKAFAKEIGNTFVVALNETSGIADTCYVSVGALGVNAIDVGGYNLYPNPVENQLYIDGVKQNSTFRIINLQGVVVCNGNMGSSQLIDVQHLPTGVYILQLYEQSSSIHISFKKQ